MGSVIQDKGEGGEITERVKRGNDSCQGQQFRGHDCQTRSLDGERTREEKEGKDTLHRDRK